ncbi:hypothetical protein EAG_07995 [Camponotus floridanus]|uniref:Uncharacterized protein n=1 Tax=Camponotus floridanus TaxID=104421 RepID=E2AIC0_CAMFO|nr:hypothetical protein EAG_07995 [Camponotus floridanus]
MSTRTFMEDIGEVGVCARATCMSSSDVVAPCGAVISIITLIFSTRMYRSNLSQMDAITRTCELACQFLNSQHETAATEASVVYRSPFESFFLFLAFRLWSRRERRETVLPRQRPKFHGGAKTISIKSSSLLLSNLLTSTKNVRPQEPRLRAREMENYLNSKCKRGPLFCQDAWLPGVSLSLYRSMEKKGEEKKTAVIAALVTVPADAARPPCARAAAFVESCPFKSLKTIKLRARAKVWMNSQNRLLSDLAEILCILRYKRDFSPGCKNGLIGEASLRNVAREFFFDKNYGLYIVILMNVVDRRNERLHLHRSCFQMSPRCEILFADSRYRLEFAEKSHDEVSPMGRSQEFVMTQADSPSQGEPRGMSRSSTRGMAAIDLISVTDVHVWLIKSEYDLVATVCLTQNEPHLQTHGANANVRFQQNAHLMNSWQEVGYPVRRADVALAKESSLVQWYPAVQANLKKRRKEEKERYRALEKNPSILSTNYAVNLTANVRIPGLEVVIRLLRNTKDIRDLDLDFTGNLPFLPHSLQADI